MAIKTRPKGSISELLNLDAGQISAMSERELRGVVSKLNDAANKRIARGSKAGISSVSPSLRGKEKLHLSKGMSKNDLKTAYTEAKNFLQSKTSTITGTRALERKFEGLYDSVLNKSMKNPNNLDKRYKTPTLKKSVEKKAISNFWDEYHKFREIEMKNNPSSAGTTNINDVERFKERLYDAGLTDLEDYEDYSEDEYESEEERRLREIDESVNELEPWEYEEDEEEQEPVRPAPIKRSGKGRTSSAKLPKSGTKTTYGKTTKGKGGIKQRFEKVKIF